MKAVSAVSINDHLTLERLLLRIGMTSRSWFAISRPGFRHYRRTTHTHNENYKAFDPEKNRECFRSIHANLSHTIFDQEARIPAVFAPRNPVGQLVAILQFTQKTGPMFK